MKCEQCNNKFCKTLDEKTRSQLCDYSVIITQKRKQIEFYYDLKDNIEIILDGFCVVEFFSFDGKRLFNNILAPSDVLGQYFDFDVFKTAPLYNIVALTDVKKCIIPRKIYDKLFKNNKDFADAVTHNLITPLFRLQKWTLLPSLTGYERVEYICNELKRMGLKDLNSITQEDIAFIAGVSRVTVIRAMKKIILADDKTDNFFP